MSGKIVGRVFDLPLAPGVKLTALALADFASHDGSRVFPRQSLVAQMTGHTTRTVRRHIADLKEIGVLVPVGTKGSTKRVVEYRFDLEEMDRQIRPHSDTSSKENRSPVSGHPSDIHPNEDTSDHLMRTFETGNEDTGVLHNRQEPPREPPIETPRRSARRPVEVVVDNRLTETPSAMDELVALFGKPSSGSGGTWARFQRIVNLARGHPPGEITRRAELHAAALGFAVTLGSLEKRWDELGGSAAQVSALPHAERQRHYSELQRQREEETGAWARRMEQQYGK